VRSCRAQLVTDPDCAKRKEDRERGKCGNSERQDDPNAAQDSVEDHSSILSP